MQFWKTEKTCWRYHHFTHVYQKTTIIWGTAPEIQSETDMIFYHFGGFFALLLPNKPKNQNFKQMKKSSGDVIILHMCSKNHDHMMYASWDMECDSHNFLPGDIIILHSCTINEDHMMHCSWDIKARRTESIFWKNEEYAWRYYYFTLVYYKWRLYDVWFLRYGAWWIYYFVIFHFGVLLPPPPSPGLTTPSPPKKRKWKKTPGDIIMWCVPKIMIRWCMIPEIWCTANRWMDGRTEKLT